MGASVLVAATLIWVGTAFTAPKTKEKVLIQDYEVIGEFDHKKYGHSERGKAEPNPVHFPQIIDSMTAFYEYKFSSEEPASVIGGTARISAILSNPGQWEKEVDLVSGINHKGSFNIVFQLNAEEFVELADNIGEEIGVKTTAPVLTLKATVNTKAETKSGVVEEDFIQTLRLRLTPTVIGWYRPFYLSRKGYNDGLYYDQQGSFGYSVHLKPNVLYGDITMNSYIPPVPPPIKLADNIFYELDNIEFYEVTFDSKMKSEEGLSNIKYEVEVNAVLHNPNGEEVFFPLVPRNQQEGELRVTFPLDIVLLYDIIRVVEGEIDESTPDYRLVVEANVHILAESELGPIEEDFSDSLVLTLAYNGPSWPAIDVKTTPGSITKTVVVPNSDRMTGIMGSLGVLGMMVVLLIYAIYLYRQSEELPAWDAEAIRVKKERQDVIVDVQELTPPSISDTVIPFDSLDELVKMADALLKPVLHKAEPEKHTYQVIDGTVRYMYGLSKDSPG